MKIAIDISQIAYKGTGVANYTAELVRHLLTIDKENEYILFGLSFRNIKTLQDYWEKVRSLNPHLTRKFFLIPQTISNFFWNHLHQINIEIFIGKIDIFHSSDWIQPPSHAKKVTTVHDLVVYKYPETSHPEIVATQKRRLYWVKREVDLILADSFSTKQDLVTILHFAPAKIEVVYPGVGQEFKPQNEEEKVRVRQKYNLLDDYILTVGTLEPRKNLKRTISTFERFLHHPLVAARKKPIELVVVGKVGWGTLPSISRYVHLLGYVAPKDLPELYSGAYLFVYPSLYEGFGLPVLEAAACGCPVVTSNRGSLKELVSDSAMVVDPEMEEDIAVAMTKLYVDSNLREELIKKGKENASKFTWEEAARRVKGLYEQVVTSK